MGSHCSLADAWFSVVFLQGSPGAESLLQGFGVGLSGMQFGSKGSQRLEGRQGGFSRACRVCVTQQASV